MIILIIDIFYIMEISDRLKLLRKTLRLTQTSFASAIKLSRSGYAAIEMKLTGLTERNFDTICSVYSVNPEWLSTGKGEMFLETKKEETDTFADALQRETGYNREWIETGMGKMFEKSQVIYKKADITDRFLIAIEQLKISGTSYTEVASRIGASPSLVSEIRRGKTKLSSRFAERFIESFGINPDWLLNGKGEMLGNDVPGAHVIDFAKTEWINVQLVPIHARATFAATYLDSNTKELECIRILKRKGINYTKAKVFEVDGDSMEPTLITGEQVLCELVDPADWKYVTGPVVVAFGNNMIVIKRIKDNELASGRLVLWSDNEIGGKITLCTENDEIRQMYRVRYTVYKPIR